LVNGTKADLGLRKAKKALKSYIVIEKKSKTGKVISKYPKQINLFTKVR